MPALYGDFLGARPAFWRLTADLPSTLRDRRRRVPDLGRLPVPVRVVFGASEGLPSVATNLLAERLRRLEAAGLVAQESGADARTRVYRLTERGAELDGVVGALARFGLALLPGDADGLAFRAEWLATAVRYLLRPGMLDDDLVVRFDVGPESVVLRLKPAGVTVDPDAAPDVVVAGDRRRWSRCCATPPRRRTGGSR